ncbi:hypothetical protein P152DRAFT_515973 [Eremomyces bilateralis CBS 781.70]|uniref:BRCT domain-containing protein n=1 Tax=Eremomyces bilateralis CBS 781.70 TaxID=1392243 RepID=A0A6G1FX71_9PEZI|nr:uncharacterized protein P152DRAFT_515973 [Eremomyces bilateralis CBS 781.70]KAF1810437.1 hypothetical protein P152DRAFT_515973 [Eremomyces bilateralis CBS 781.70]
MAPVTRARAAKTKPPASPKRSKSPKKPTLKAPPKRARKPTAAPPPETKVEEDKPVPAAPKATASTRASRTKAAAIGKPTTGSRARAAPKTTTTTSTSSRTTRKRPAKDEDDPPKASAPPRKRTRSAAKAKPDQVPEPTPAPVPEPEPEFEAEVSAEAIPTETGVGSEAHNEDTEAAPIEGQGNTTTETTMTVSTPASPSKVSRIPRPSPQTTPQSTSRKASAPHFSPQLFTHSIGRSKTAHSTKNGLKESLLGVSPRKLKLPSVTKSGTNIPAPASPSKEHVQELTPKVVGAGTDPFCLNTPVASGFKTAPVEGIEQSPAPDANLDGDDGYLPEIVESQFEAALAALEEPAPSIPLSTPAVASPERHMEIHVDEPASHYPNETEHTVIQSPMTPTRPPQTPRTAKSHCEGFGAAIKQPVFADTPNEPLVRTTSIFSSTKSFGSARRPPAKEKFLQSAPRRSCLTVPPKFRQMAARIPDRLSSLNTSPTKAGVQKQSGVRASPGKLSASYSAVSSPTKSPKRSPLKEITEELGTMAFDQNLCMPRDASLEPISRPVFVDHEETETPDATITLEEFINTPFLQRTPTAKAESAVESAVSFAPLGKVPELNKPICSPTKSSIRSPERRLSPKKSVTFQEEKSPLSSPNSSLLEGVIAFVDVNTNDGADATHLFKPLLEEMGAVCVPQWTSNSMSITHVIFKDGDSMTLEKVVASNDAVLAVNIAWPIDCERFNKRLDEQSYLINLSHIPGSPRPLHSRSPNASPVHDAKTPACPTPVHFKSTPSRPRTPRPGYSSSRFAIKTPAWLAGSINKHASTPNLRLCSPENKENEENLANFPCGESEGGYSPTTPYFLKPSNLVQQTCPPKQHGQSMFLVDDAQTSFKQRLMLAKRRSLEFAPKVPSPLRAMRQNPKFGY